MFSPNYYCWVTTPRQNVHKALGASWGLLCFSESTALTFLYNYALIEEVRELRYSSNIGPKLTFRKGFKMKQQFLLGVMVVVMMTKATAGIGQLPPVERVTNNSTNEVLPRADGADTYWVEVLSPGGSPSVWGDLRKNNQSVSLPENYTGRVTEVEVYGGHTVTAAYSGSQPYPWALCHDQVLLYHGGSPPVGGFGLFDNLIISSSSEWGCLSLNRLVKNGGWVDLPMINFPGADQIHLAGVRGQAYFYTDYLLPAWQGKIFDQAGSVLLSNLGEIKKARLVGDLLIVSYLDGGNSHLISYDMVGGTQTTLHNSSTVVVGDLAQDGKNVVWVMADLASPGTPAQIEVLIEGVRNTIVPPAPVSTSLARSSLSVSGSTVVWAGIPLGESDTEIYRWRSTNAVENHWPLYE